MSRSIGVATIALGLFGSLGLACQSTTSSLTEPESTAVLSSSTDIASEGSETTLAGLSSVEGEGCGTGYWKTHTDSWPPVGYSPAQSVRSVFPAASAYPSQFSTTLLEALSFHGGSGVEGAVRNLLRAAVAALLNSSHPGVDYSETPAAVIGDVDAALASGDRARMLMLAHSLDDANHGACPLH